MNWQAPSQEDAQSMSRIWIISRAALAEDADRSNHARKLWCAKQIAAKHNISESAAHKAMAKARIGELTR